MTRALVCFGPLLFLASLAQAGEETIRLKDAAARDLTAARCAMCHSLDYIQMNAAVMDRPAWEKSVLKMIDRFGAPVSDDEAKQIVDYLAKHYSSDGA
jgi:sulfite dehydrogenase (cytochrome) subunit B